MGLNDFESSILNNSVSNDFGTSSPLINNTDEEFVSSETDLGDPLEWKINKKYDFKIEKTTDDFNKY